MEIAVPLTCAISLDTQTLSMKNRVIQRKLNLCLHLKKLKNEDLAKQVFEEQRENSYPGLVSDCHELCEQLGIPDITKERIKDPSKGQWKKIVKEAIEKKYGKELKEKIDKLEKLEIMKGEDYGQKDYLSELSMEEARMHFRVRTRTIKCKLNQSNDKGNKSSLWKCRACGYIESQTHLLHCPAYQDLRSGKSLDSDRDLAIYFRDVLKLRDKLDT